ncbi:MAG: hypothetical protein F4Z15_07070 [Gammaproteobacteria bacterium]|nr:hypothetical protein [Gammaproteobacteria bacterium]MYD77002.1 hypothetical protein [Gammaproteobacteria bacterium]MYJ52466.1 hypothetical protein [Gammaproteobacteria bacterium]
MRGRRDFLIRSGYCALSATGVMQAGIWSVPVVASPGPNTVFRSRDIDSVLIELFQTADSGQDGSLRIDVPVEAVNASVVPFRIVASNTERLAVFVEGNARPLLLVTEEAHRPHREMTGAFRLDRDSLVTCYALRQGELFRNSRPVRLIAPRHNVHWREEFRDRLPLSTILRAEAAGGGFDILCSIRHNRGRWLVGDPHVARVTFSVNDQSVSTVECGPGFSRNPLVGVHLESLGNDDVVRVEWTDSSGVTGMAQGTVALLSDRNLYRET